MTTPTTRSSAVVAAVLGIGLLVTACAPASPSTPADIATDLASAFIAADVDRANEVLCEGAWEEGNSESFELGIAGPDRWDFTGLGYSIRDESKDGVVLGNLGADVEFDVTTTGDGDATCVSGLSINGANEYVKD